MNRFRSSAVFLALLFTACSQNDTTGPSIRQVWIPMEDGVRLAADIYFPDAQGGTDRYPVLLEYLPYRKNEIGVEPQLVKTSVRTRFSRRASDAKASRR